MPIILKFSPNLILTLSTLGIFIFQSPSLRLIEYLVHKGTFRTSVFSWSTNTFTRLVCLRTIRNDNNQKRYEELFYRLLLVFAITGSRYPDIIFQDWKANPKIQLVPD